ncbi:MAG: hypothetical protein LUI87_04910 [Lachnospiraceae bacterium]|nr:hypothetical protein [Lachnospiraceae bacterium]
MAVLKICLKSLGKLMLLPILVVTIMLKWVGTFVVFCSAWIFRILAMILFLTAVLSGMMGLEEWPAVWKMLAGTFVVFMIPCVGEALVAVTKIASGALAAFMVS